MSWRYYFHPATYNLIIKQNGFFMTDKVMKIYTLMVNTLWNTSEKVTSTPRGSSSSALKKIVAAAIALTLSGQPAEAKTYNKQEFPTEMVANVPWEISPMTENVEQTNIPNYIDQAQKAVKKYYPQYEEYFKPIFDKINKLNKSFIEIINQNFDNAIKKSKDELKTEKQVYTMILMTLEKLVWKSSFYNDNNITKNEEERENEEWIASVITEFITEWFEEKWKEMEQRKKMTERIDNLFKKNSLTIEDTEELLDIIEELYNKIENTEYINDKRIKFIFNEYYTRSKNIWRQPNETWKKIIKRLKDHQ